MEGWANLNPKIWQPFVSEELGLEQPAYHKLRIATVI